MSDFVADFAKGRWDVPFWAERFLGVKLHPGQVRMADAYIRRERRTGWRPENYDIAVSAGNRAGKTMALAVIILHSCFYKMGSEPPVDDSDAEVTRWMKRPYLAFHFAIAQEIADLVYTECLTLLSGTHVAQARGCPLLDQFVAEGGEKLAEMERKYNGDYRWVVLDKHFGGAEIHFRTTGEKALGSLGRDMHLISFDECGLEPRLTWIYENVLRHRRLGTGGQLFLVSTPEEGLTEFSDFWFMGDPEAPDRRARHMSVRMSTRDNIGFGIDEFVFADLVADLDDAHVKQNIDGYFIQGRTAFFNHQSVDRAFDARLPEQQAARPDRFYVQGVDPAIKVDALWSIVFDATDEYAVGVYVDQARGKKTTDGIVELVSGVHYAYEHAFGTRRSTCSTAIDATGFGGKMFKQELDDAILGGVRAIEFGGTTQKKRKLLGDLRTMLDQGKLKMPRSGKWLVVRRQLLGYKIDDRNIEQDAVMALACAVAEIRRTPAGANATETDFDWMVPV